MPRKKLDSIPEGRDAFDSWLETEYNVVLEWGFRPAPNVCGYLATRIVLTAVPTPWADVSMGHWEVSTDVRVDTPAAKLEKVYRVLQSKLALDLQVERMYGAEECVHFVPTRGPC